MYKVILTSSAKTDLKDIKTYISTVLNNPNSAKTIVKGITNQLHVLEHFPEMGTLLMFENSINCYRYLIHRNYISFYHIENDSVIVDRIMYGRRDYLAILFGNELNEDSEI